MIAPEPLRRPYYNVFVRQSVLMIGSEAVPFAKTGGLADVLGALPPALGRLGWDVTVALPRYRGITAGTLSNVCRSASAALRATSGCSKRRMADGARALLVDCPDLFDRESLYAAGGSEYPDNARRFAVLVRAALEFVARRGPPPSIVHAHDWQAGLAPVYLRTLFASHPVLGGVPSVFTIHNLAYQGVFEPDWLPRLDLGRGATGTMDRMEFWGRISLLKGGINAARRHHHGEPALRRRNPDAGVRFGLRRHPAPRGAAELVGILNGIDTSVWDPPQRSRSAGAVQTSTSWTASARRSAPCWLATVCPPTNRRRRARSSG